MGESKSKTVNYPPTAGGGQNNLQRSPSRLPLNPDNSPRNHHCITAECICLDMTDQSYYKTVLFSVKLIFIINFSGRGSNRMRIIEIQLFQSLRDQITNSKNSVLVGTSYSLDYS